MESGLLFSFKIVFWLTETDSPQPVPRPPPPNVLVDHVLCDSALLRYVCHAGKVAFWSLSRGLTELLVKHDLLYGYNSTRSVIGY